MKVHQGWGLETGTAGQAADLLQPDFHRFVVFSRKFPGAAGHCIFPNLRPVGACQEFELCVHPPGAISAATCTEIALAQLGALAGRAQGRQLIERRDTHWQGAADFKSDACEGL